MVVANIHEQWVDPNAIKAWLLLVPDLEAALRHGPGGIFKRCMKSEKM